MTMLYKIEKKHRERHRRKCPGRIIALAKERKKCKQRSDTQNRQRRREMSDLKIKCEFEKNNRRKRKGGK